MAERRHGKTEVESSILSFGSWFILIIIRSKRDRSFYTGITKNPTIRLSVHNRGGLKITAKKRPWEIVYKKRHANYDEARKHEKWLKKKSREYKEKLAQLAPPEPS